LFQKRISQLISNPDLILAARQPPPVPPRAVKAAASAAVRAKASTVVRANLQHVVFVFHNSPTKSVQTERSGINVIKLFFFVANDEAK